MRGAGGEFEDETQSDDDEDAESDVEERTDAVNPQQDESHVMHPPVDDNSSVSSWHTNVIGKEAEEEVPMDAQKDYRSDISRPVFRDLTMVNQTRIQTPPQLAMKVRVQQRHQNVRGTSAFLHSAF